MGHDRHVTPHEDNAQGVETTSIIEHILPTGRVYRDMGAPVSDDQGCAAAGDHNEAQKAVARGEVCGRGLDAVTAWQRELSRGSVLLLCRPGGLLYGILWLA